MTETPEDQNTDELRRHAEEPAEGGEPGEATEDDDVPREHPEDA
jgi:hypothetical protein